MSRELNWASIKTQRSRNMNTWRHDSPLWCDNSRSCGSMLSSPEAETFMSWHGSVGRNILCDTRGVQKTLLLSEGPTTRDLTCQSKRFATWFKKTAMEWAGLATENQGIKFYAVWNRTKKHNPTLCPGWRNQSYGPNADSFARSEVIRWFTARQKFTFLSAWDRRNNNSVCPNIRLT